jgi:S-adenosylmethionine synthetase
MTEGHPDKVCDQISDAVLDEIIESDPEARVACETMAGVGFIIVAGEVTTRAYADVGKIVRDVLKDVGYTKPEYGFDYRSVGVLTAIHEQSPDIAMGVNAKGKKIGAGDQGMMSGYATNETPQLMPLPILLAHRLTKKLAEARKLGVIPHLRPDGKSQVTVKYDHGTPESVDSVVIAAQHDPEIEIGELREQIREKVIEPACGEWLSPDTKYFINNTGRFVIGGPVADTGCTGRKIVADTYGGVIGHGGGAFSGKDPTKVDKSASYMARYIAKNIVAAGLAEKCEIQLSYVIGGSEPLSLMVDVFQTNGIQVERIVDQVKKNFDLSVGGMIEQLDLRRPIYRKTSNYGHFGREDPDFTWEKTDLAEELRALAS